MKPASITTRARYAPDPGISPDAVGLVVAGRHAGAVAAHLQNHPSMGPASMTIVDGMWHCRAPGFFARRLTKRAAVHWLAAHGYGPDGTPIATPADIEAAAKVMAYADRHVANRGLKPTFPALWACDRPVLDAWPVIDTNHPNPTIKSEVAHFTGRALALAAVAAAEAKYAAVIAAQRARGE